MSTTSTNFSALPSTMTTATTVGSVNVSAQRATVIAAFQALVDGIQSELPDVTSVVINRQTITKAQLVSDFQERLTAAEATKAARLAYHAAVAAEARIAERVAPERAGVKLYLAARYGKSSPELQKFGFTPAKVPQKTAASKAAAVAKARVTRQTLGTMGPKQKMAALAIHEASTARASVAQQAAIGMPPPDMPVAAAAQVTPSVADAAPTAPA